MGKPLKILATSGVCAERLHCATCRDLEGGRSWRKGLGKIFELSGVDFECPHGVGWGETPERIIVPKSEPPKLDHNQRALAAMEAAGMTPDTARKEAKRGGCCGGAPKKDSE